MYGCVRSDDCQLWLAPASSSTRSVPPVCQRLKVSHRLDATFTGVLNSCVDCKCRRDVRFQLLLHLLFSTVCRLKLYKCFSMLGVDRFYY